jgi:hypothetical protein
MSNGSGLFSTKGPQKPHLVHGKKGVAGEVDDLRRDVLAEMEPMAALTVEEWTNVAQADTDGVLASVATTTAAVTHEAADLVGGDSVVLDPPRNLTLKCDDSAATWAGDLTATGAAINGDAITEDIAFTNNATTPGAKCFARVDSLSRGAQVDGNGHYEVGFGTIIGLAKPMKTRAGAGCALASVEAGTLAAAPAGTVAPAATGAPNGSYDPSAAPNGTNDYALYYEYSPV